MGHILKLPFHNIHHENSVAKDPSETQMEMGQNLFVYPQDWVLPWFFLQRTKNWDTQAVGRRGFTNWFSLKNGLGTYQRTDVPR